MAIDKSGRGRLADQPVAIDASLKWRSHLRITGFPLQHRAPPQRFEQTPCRLQKPDLILGVVNYAGKEYQVERPFLKAEFVFAAFLHYYVAEAGLRHAAARTADTRLRPEISPNTTCVLARSGTSRNSSSS